MPLAVLTADQTKAAFETASSDVKYHLAELEVSDEVQAALYNAGITTLRLLANLDDTHGTKSGHV